MINVLFFTLFINLLIFLNYSRIARIYNVYDIPDDVRKHHKNRVPLLGGLIIYFNLFVFIIFSYLDFFGNFIFQSKNEINLFFISVSLLFILGFLDDKYNVSANKKLLII